MVKSKNIFTKTHSDHNRATKHLCSGVKGKKVHSKLRGWDEWTERENQGN